MTDQFNWWKRALANERGLPLSEKPEAGFYRQRTRDKKGFEPVAYWYENERLMCKVGVSRMVDDLRAREMWPFVSCNPISHELYETVTERGEPWPDLHEAVTALTNNPPDDYSLEGLSEAIEDLTREANKLAALGAAKDQDAADRAGDLANKLGELEKKADIQRRLEKKPHEDAAKAVDASWNPIRDMAAAAKTLLKSAVITPFLRAKDEAERKAREEAAKAGAPAPEAPRGVSTTKAGTRGRAVALKSVKKAKINDLNVALNHFAAHPKIADLVQQLADAHVRSIGTPPPGCEITEEKVAA